MPLTALPAARTSLFWRVCVINGLVFVVGTVVLAASPATVSSPVVLTEAAVLAVGIGVILAANALLLRSTLVPIDRLIRSMARVDPLQPGERLPVAGEGAVADLVRAYNAMVERLEAERSVSNARALEAQEAERRRIAQELHDEVGQSLTAVVLQLKRIGDACPPELAADVGAAREAARASLDEVRAVARRLRPGVLEDLGLASALAEMAAGFEDLTGARVARSIEPALPRLSPSVELVVYRVAQEALTNVARHAGATRVDLSLRMSDGTLELVVADDGRGLGVAAEGAGVRGMRERALLVGADLGLLPAPAGGLAVRLRVPIERVGAG